MAAEVKYLPPQHPYEVRSFSAGVASIPWEEDSGVQIPGHTTWRWNYLWCYFYSRPSCAVRLRLRLQVNSQLCLASSPPCPAWLTPWQASSRAWPHKPPCATPSRDLHQRNLIPGKNGLCLCNTWDYILTLLLINCDFWKNHVTTLSLSFLTWNIMVGSTSEDYWQSTLQ